LNQYFILLNQYFRLLNQYFRLLNQNIHKLSQNQSHKLLIQLMEIILPIIFFSECDDHHHKTPLKNCKNPSQNPKIYEVNQSC
jgi:hypothetical protein